VASPLRALFGQRGIGVREGTPFFEEVPPPLSTGEGTVSFPRVGIIWGTVFFSHSPEVSRAFSGGARQAGFLLHVHGMDAGRQISSSQTLASLPGQGRRRSLEIPATPDLTVQTCFRAPRRG